MSERFFDLSDDVYIPHRWDLGMPQNTQGIEVDDWQFRLGEPVHLQERLRIPVESAGMPLDYTEAGVRLPVIHVRIASLFAELAQDDVQLLPVDIEGQPDQYLILVVARRIRCIDEQVSRIQFWPPEAGFPDMVGRYLSVRDLRIDKSKVGNAQVFRCEGWEGALIVSEKIKDALTEIGATGPRFEEV